MASGRLPPTPITIVITHATSAVAVTSWPVSRAWPYLSLALPRMTGFRTRM